MKFTIGNYYLHRSLLHTHIMHMMTVRAVKSDILENHKWHWLKLSYGVTKLCYICHNNIKTVIR